MPNKRCLQDMWNCICNEWKSDLKCKTRKLKQEEWAQIHKQILKRRSECTKVDTEHVQTPGFILSWLRCIIAVCYLLSFSKWISGTSKKQKRIDNFDLSPYKCIDIYVTAWFFLELLTTIVFATCNIKYNTHACLVNTFIGLFCYRLFDIFQSWVSQFVLKSRWEAISINRSLVLAFVGYTEICIIGAFIRYVYKESITMWESIYHSVTAMIANPVDGASFIQYTQIMFATVIRG